MAGLQSPAHPSAISAATSGSPPFGTRRISSTRDAAPMPDPCPGRPGLIMALALPIAVLTLVVSTGALAGGSDVTVEGKPSTSTPTTSSMAARTITISSKPITEPTSSSSPTGSRAASGKQGDGAGPAEWKHDRRRGGWHQGAPGSTTTASATGAKKVAVILFTFSDSSAQPYTPDYARGIAFTNGNSVAAYYDESSWGQLTLSGDVFGWYQFPEQEHELRLVHGGGAPLPRGCPSRRASISAPTTTGVYAFPSVSACGWARTPLPQRNGVVVERVRRDEPARDGARAWPQLRDAPRKLLRLVHRRRRLRLAPRPTARAAPPIEHGDPVQPDGASHVATPPPHQLLPS